MATRSNSPSKSPISTGNVTVDGWLRIGVYGLLIVVGLLLAFKEQLGIESAAEGLADLAELLAVLGGGTAILNVSKANDQAGPAAVKALQAEVSGLKARTASSEEVADKVAERIAPAPDVSPEEAAGARLPVYDGPTTN